jgi:protein-L-isoaspartate(D-aspartate) O-methyltransferase
LNIDHFPLSIEDESLESKAETSKKQVTENSGLWQVLCEIRLTGERWEMTIKTTSGKMRQQSSGENMPKRSLILASLWLALSVVFDASAEDPAEAEFRLLREKMVKEQISDAPDFRDPVKDPRVLTAMRTVPRHHFVEKRLQSEAYGDFPLPIGYGQTISQPYVVALMTEMLEVKPDHKVLEVGAGSGYQAAVLSLLVKEVYTIEIVEALALQAQERLKRLKYANVSVRVGDGYYGWEEAAPFDRIIVTCAASLVPPPLLKQLKPGGKMCIPVGAAYSVQYLTMVEKSETGTITMRKSIPVRFVPLTRSGDEQ